MDLKTARSQIINQKGRIDNLEKRFDGIKEEFEDLIQGLTNFVNAFYSGDPAELEDSVMFAERVLARMRERYG